ncbi:hypothetical protein [Leuconostoc pseudomesenteroides]|uniref:hypothetical protein n=1 Tax=Leuconostoc pseudomesenteroides TaxID=33968 RepID=UPI0032DF17BD
MTEKTFYLYDDNNYFSGSIQTVNRPANGTTKEPYNVNGVAKYNSNLDEWIGVPTEDYIKEISGKNAPQNIQSQFGDFMMQYAQERMITNRTISQLSDRIEKLEKETTDKKGTNG